VTPDEPGRSGAERDHDFGQGVFTGVRSRAPRRTGGDRGDVGLREAFHCKIDMTPYKMRIGLYGLCANNVLPQCKIATLNGDALEREDGNERVRI
jgi:hypothetical protein